MKKHSLKIATILLSICIAISACSRRQITELNMSTLI